MVDVPDDLFGVADGNARGGKSMRMTTEEIEVRIWAIISLCLAAILVLSVVSIIFGVLFVEHDLERISPIDTQLIGILKDIMLLAIGAVGGLVGRKGAYAAANMLTKKEDGDATTRPTA